MLCFLLLPSSSTELLARDLIQEAWYEFRVMAVMEELVSEPSNTVGVSSTDFFPPPEMVDEGGLTRPVVAGIVATVCFLAAAVLFSTLAACFVNKQRRRKLKRRRGWCSITIKQHALYVRLSTSILVLFKQDV
ncbi:unnamed protein product [Oncorhynchus mykiss]|uniref:Fibronectin type-III domain-containing protein n=1 Tax=Oncorhynchus mykiss TaxID=8022 RepID=A0A060VXX0_ONCMY|nr:unnamed protein product [Oncorhynchus mykiss]